MLLQIYLAGARKEMIVGDYIAAVKTIKDTSVYSKEIQDGINLYQTINDFAEVDPAVLESRKRLNPKYSKYSAAIIEFFYDHFLAAHWGNYSSISMEKFSMNVYKALLEYQKVLPYKAKLFLPRMIRGNWLEKFVTLGGVHQVINQMDIKSTKLTHIVSAFEDLISEYKEFQHDFQDFFPRVVKYVSNRIERAGYSYEHLVMAAHR
jgi:acyl carrier protein phosphodiesterase